MRYYKQVIINYGLFERSNNMGFIYTLLLGVVI
ncbi:hypothetical protein CYOC110262_16905 [Cytobacillus oceanisediminis]